MLLKSRLFKKQKYQRLYTRLGPLIIVTFLKRKVISGLLSNNMHLLKIQWCEKTADLNEIKLAGPS